MLRKFLLAVPAALALAGIASADGRPARPVTVVTAPLPIVTLNPQPYSNPYYANPFNQTPVLNQNPTSNRPVVLPATWTKPAVIPTQITPWGIQPAQLIPGVYTPPQVATVGPSKYTPVSQWTAINPVNGNVYDGWNNTSTNTDGTYQYNPWTNTFFNPNNNATYNPNNGVTIRPLSSGIRNTFANPYPQPVFIR